jgi:hypothetical protein
MRDVARDLSCRAGIHPGLGLQSGLMKNAQNRSVTVFVRFYGAATVTERTAVGIFQRPVNRAPHRTSQNRGVRNAG